MKEFFIKYEMILRLMSLLFVMGSVFATDILLKMVLLFAGVLGLILIVYAKGQKSLVILFSILLVIAIIGYWYLNPSTSI